MNLILYGPSCCGKSTLMRLLAKKGFTPVPTGDITRLLYSTGATCMPYIVQTIISTMKPDNYCFDHFYIHTWEQLNNKFDSQPIVIRVVDARKNPTYHSQAIDKIKRKQARFEAQSAEIEAFFKAHDITPITVTNTDYGFDMSELIEHKIIPYEELVVQKPEVNNV